MGRERIFDICFCLVWAGWVLLFSWKLGPTTDEIYFHPRKTVFKVDEKGIVWNEEKYFPNSARVREIFDGVATITRPLPPVYLLRVGETEIPLKTWLHTGPVYLLFQKLCQSVFFFLPPHVAWRMSGVVLGIIVFFVARMFAGPMQCAVAMLVFGFVLNSAVQSAYTLVALTSFGVFAFGKRFVDTGKRTYALLGALCGFVAFASYIPSLIAVFVSAVSIFAPSRRFPIFLLYLALFCLFPALFYVAQSIDSAGVRSIVPPSSLSIFKFASFGPEKFLWMLRDLNEFFEYETSGRTLIFKEVSDSFISVHLVLFAVLLFLSARFAKDEIEKRAVFWIVLFVVFQALLFPLPDHPRRFVPLAPFFAVALNSALRVRKTKFLLIAIAFVIAQVSNGVKVLQKLRENRSWHVYYRWEDQKKLSEYLVSMGIKEVVNIDTFADLWVSSEGKVLQVELSYITALSPSKLPIALAHLSSESKIWAVANSQNFRDLLVVCIRAGLSCTKRAQFGRYTVLTVSPRN